MRLLVVTMVLLSSACATVSHVDPALFRARSFALASVHARTAIDFQNMGTGAPMLYDNELGIDALEMELGEIEMRLGEILGTPLLPPSKVLAAAKAYDLLPEAQPAAAWSQLNGMTAVDVEQPQAAAALGGLARALNVDAAIVLRHEWSVRRDKFEMGEGVTVSDRCTILVVDRDGRPLWNEVVLTRVPVMPMFSGSFTLGTFGGTWSDEAVQNARRTAKIALDELAQHYQRERTRPAELTGTSSR